MCANREPLVLHQLERALNHNGVCEFPKSGKAALQFPLDTRLTGTCPEVERHDALLGPLP